MTKSDIHRALAEANRFVSRCYQALEANSEFPDDKFNLGPSKETAALKRASLDLTRALADMRRRRE